MTGSSFQTIQASAPTYYVARRFICAKLNDAENYQAPLYVVHFLIKINGLREDIFGILFPCYGD